MPAKKHLGFKKTQAKIAKKQGISKKAAGAILASAARKASPAAVKKNPALKNVPGVKKYEYGGITQPPKTVRSTGYKVPAKNGKSLSITDFEKLMNRKPTSTKKVFRTGYKVQVKK